MGQSLPSFQPEDADSGHSRCSQRCGCEPTNRDPETDGHEDFDQVVNPTLSGHDGSVAPLNSRNDQHGIPFVVQAGRRLFMLASDGPHSPIGDHGVIERERPINPGGIAYEASQWVLAELRFDTASCTFVEARRVRYDWPREAFGSMLARVAVGDEIDRDLISRVTADFSVWLASQFIVVRRP